jgi:DNA invertase Pin-like site-specific DNA recombinase
MRAVIYARYSTDLQRDASIDDQVRLCSERAAREAWRVVQSYCDRGTSGASLVRPGIQNLLRDARDGTFDIVIAEALDRLSRDLSDVAGLFKQLGFLSIRLVTLAEGEINELHVGLKGTMNALFLKDLADKTRRGLRGRVAAGMSGGGNSYGYDVVRNLDGDGEPLRGGRSINKAQAAIVCRIFNDYAAGIAPRAIAKQLNAEGVASPSGKGWGPSTIHGNRGRGTGILNNELYIGRLVWNRLRYVKDPNTGRRISRLNPRNEWITQDVHHLRIIDEELWERVKARQRSLDASQSGEPAAGYWKHRRPRFLLTGLMKCGRCGGGFVNFNRVYVGCANARNKGTCDNKATMRRADLEAMILEGLQHRLMDDRLVRIFCEEFTRYLNRLRGDAAAQQGADKAALARTERELDRLVQALADGIPASRVKEKMVELESRREALQARLSMRQEEKTRIHPSMAKHYRLQIEALRATLTGPEAAHDAVEIVRGLIDRIVLTPADQNVAKALYITLEGHIAGILALATKAKAPLDEGDACVSVTKLVAGAGFEPLTFRLCA